jgi:hypothetical protein
MAATASCPLKSPAAKQMGRTAAAARFRSSGGTRAPNSTSPSRARDWPTPRRVEIQTAAESATPRPARMPIMCADMPALRKLAAVAISA